MRIFYENILNTASLSSATENPSYPLTNLQDGLKMTKYRSTSELTQNVIIDNTGTTASWIFIDNHNFTAGATVKIEGNDTNAWGAPTFSETIPYSSGMMYFAFTEQTFNYWRIYINDAGNTDGYIEFGLAYLGTFIQMPGMKPTQQLPRKTTSNQSISIGGQVFGDERILYREFSVDFQNVSNDQRLAINELFDTVHNIRPVMLLIWANELDFEPPMYCVIDQNDIPWRKNGDGYINPWSCKLSFREVF